jgi:uncharacterized membrane protein
MREHEIECRVERMVDRPDARYTRGELSEAEYRAEMERVKQWADTEYAKR